MLMLKIVEVSHHTGTEQRTSLVKWNGTDPTYETTDGAEWEDVTFTLVENDKPSYRVANIWAPGMLNAPAKLTIVDPRYFGTYKAGDLIPFHAGNKL